jgi:hypothetical protein
MDSIKVVIQELQKQLDRIDEIRQRGLLSSEFKVWHNKCLSMIEEVFGTESSYVRRFKGITYSHPQENTRTPELLKKKAFSSGLYQVKELIENCINYLSDNDQKLDKPIQRNIQFIETLCHRFPRIVRQISKEYRGRKTVTIKDEYDVQHILHALLIVGFDDIRPEEWNPSYAGAASRVDFLLKHEKIVIEVKKTRENLKDKEIGEQLIVDIKRYSQNQDCETLICFVYDPDRFISNSNGLEGDLTGRHDKLEVKVIIAPND